MVTGSLPPNAVTNARHYQNSCLGAGLSSQGKGDNLCPLVHSHDSSWNLGAALFLPLAVISSQSLSLSVSRCCCCLPWFYPKASTAGSAAGCCCLPAQSHLYSSCHLPWRGFFQDSTMLPQCPLCRVTLRNISGSSLLCRAEEARTSCWRDRSRAGADPGLCPAAFLSHFREVRLEKAEGFKI